MTFLVERLADLRQHLDHLRTAQALRRFPQIPGDVVDELMLLPGFRNALIHEYVALDYDRVVDALNRLEPVERFVRIVTDMENEGSPADG